jgi:hypothetical protein
MSIWDTYKRISGGNMLKSFFHPEDAYKKAQEAADQGYNEAQDYQRPIMQHGEDQYGDLNTARQRLMNPGALENEWAGGYEQSPYAKQLLQQNQTSGLDAASSMGLNGSSAAIGNIQQGAGQIVNADRRQYMEDLMKKYMTGIGLGEDIYGAGANAAGNMGNRAFEHGQSNAGLAYGKEAAPGELFGNLLHKGMDAGANYATGGAYGATKGLGGNSMNNNYQQ